MATSYNPDYQPTGIEGGMDTNALPWMALPGLGDISIKPLRASSESGMFSAIVQIQGVTRDRLVFLGGADLMMLAGVLQVQSSEIEAVLHADVWGYIPANVRVDSLRSESEPAQVLLNCFGAIAVVNDDNKVKQLITALDVALLAADHNVTLVPNTLAECMTQRGAPNPNGGVELATADTVVARSETFAHAHFVDTTQLPWIENPGLPDIALKILRVSEETGFVSLIVRHNGVAGPHYHLGAADFLVLSGRIGYRAGPPEGYGRGVWFYEPAGARHEATQRIGEDEDLIYTANVYGPVQFDEGPGTPIVAVQSWMQYKEMADANGVNLVRNTLPGDASLLAWAPLGSAVA